MPDAACQHADAVPCYSASRPPGSAWSGLHYGNNRIIKLSLHAGVRRSVLGTTRARSIVSDPYALAMGNFKSALKSTSIWPKLRAAKTGAAFISVEIVGNLPSGVLRTLGARMMGMKVARTAKLYRWREMRAPQNIRVGDGSIIGMWATLDGREGITIGKNVNLSSEVALWTLQHDYNSPTFETSGSPIVIGDRAWISFRATILPGVTIGEGAVVAANSVVTKDVPPFTVVGGIPAKKIGERTADLSYEWANARSHAPWMI